MGYLTFSKGRCINLAAVISTNDEFGRWCFRKNTACCYKDEDNRNRSCFHDNWLNGLEKG